MFLWGHSLLSSQLSFNPQVVGYMNALVWFCYICSNSIGKNFCLQRDSDLQLIQDIMWSCSGTHFSKALFVPSISMYNKVTSGSSIVPLDISGKDLSWQFSLQRHWERIICGAGNIICWITWFSYLIIHLVYLFDPMD